MFDLLLLIEVGLVGISAKLGLFLTVGGIVSAEGAYLSVVNINHLGHDPVQKIPVVGYDKDSSRIIQKVRLQPGDRVHIQMVGRLIQKDDIRF